MTTCPSFGCEIIACFLKLTPVIRRHDESLVGEGSPTRCHAADVKQLERQRRTVVQQQLAVRLVERNRSVRQLRKRHFPRGDDRRSVDLDEVVRRAGFALRGLGIRNVDRINLQDHIIDQHATVRRKRRIHADKEPQRSRLHRSKGIVEIVCAAVENQTLLVRRARQEILKFSNFSGAKE